MTDSTNSTIHQYPFLTNSRHVMLTLIISLLVSLSLGLWFNPFFYAYLGAPNTPFNLITYFYIGLHIIFFITLAITLSRAPHHDPSHRLHGFVQLTTDTISFHQHNKKPTTRPITIANINTVETYFTNSGQLRQLVFFDPQKYITTIPHDSIEQFWADLQPLLPPQTHIIKKTKSFSLHNKTHYRVIIPLSYLMLPILFYFITFYSDFSTHSPAIILSISIFGLLLIPLIFTSRYYSQHGYTSNPPGHTSNPFVLFLVYLFLIMSFVDIVDEWRTNQNLCQGHACHIYNVDDAALLANDEVRVVTYYWGSRTAVIAQFPLSSLPLPTYRTINFGQRGDTITNIYMTPNGRYTLATLNQTHDLFYFNKIALYDNQTQQQQLFTNETCPSPNRDRIHRLIYIVNPAEQFAFICYEVEQQRLTTTLYSFNNPQPLSTQTFTLTNTTLFNNNINFNDITDKSNFFLLTSDTQYQLLDIQTLTPIATLPQETVATLPINFLNDIHDTSYDHYNDSFYLLLDNGQVYQWHLPSATITPILESHHTGYEMHLTHSPTSPNSGILLITSPLTSGRNHRYTQLITEIWTYDHCPNCRYQHRHNHILAPNNNLNQIRIYPQYRQYILSNTDEGTIIQPLN
ncbi:MAG TPA: hypothetical protein VLL52_07470 [Anaerolineae bacterium]|nr:hypothetical protein [Anaerolineae bacterium]